MAITKFSRNYHEKMFPKYHSAFLETDPEFIERFDNFAFDEVVNSDDLDDKTRFIAILASLLGCQGVDEFSVMLGAAMNFGVTPRDCISSNGIFGNRQSFSVFKGDEQSLY